MSVDKDRLFKKLDHVGEYAVRENLERGVYGPNRRGLVEEWLQQFDVEEEPELLVEVEHEAAASDSPADADKVSEPGETAPAESSKASQTVEPGETDKASDPADENSPKKWYQRLFGRGGN